MHRSRLVVHSIRFDSLRFGAVICTYAYRRGAITLPFASARAGEQNKDDKQTRHDACGSWRGQVGRVGGLGRVAGWVGSVGVGSAVWLASLLFSSSPRRCCCCRRPEVELELRPARHDCCCCCGCCYGSCNYGRCRCLVGCDSLSLSHPHHTRVQHMATTNTSRPPAASSSAPSSSSAGGRGSRGRGPRTNDASGGRSSSSSSSRGSHTSNSSSGGSSNSSNSSSNSRGRGQFQGRGVAARLSIVSYNVLAPVYNILAVPESIPCKEKHHPLHYRSRNVAILEQLLGTKSARSPACRARRSLPHARGSVRRCLSLLAMASLVMVTQVHCRPT